MLNAYTLNLSRIICVWTFLKYPLDAVLQIWDDITSGRAEEDSSLLSRFFIISFADLKKWTFTYRFAFPGLVMSPQAAAAACQPASDVFNSDEVTYLHGPFYFYFYYFYVYVYTTRSLLHHSCEYYIVGNISSTIWWSMEPETLQHELLHIGGFGVADYKHRSKLVT